ncbi:MAG: HlyD family efflux transporter periplasmic adaptor subunit [Gammaproteobacteria bacterium]|nr:HlyD family efflux transporter periplasmic adaptor subunit [Gammaproteobacteria bacterium]
MHPKYSSDRFSALEAIKVPRLIVVAGWAMTFLMIGLGCFLIFTPWVQTTYGAGTVTALNPNDRLQDINALVSGRILEWYVRDGSRVNIGDPIVRLVDNDPNLLQNLEAERTQVLAQLQAAETAMQTAEIDMRRMSDLFDKGLAARREYEQARIRVEELRGKIAQAAAEVSRVEVKMSRQSVQIVRAPRDGVIIRVNAGDTSTFINAGAVVATFVPDNAERAVELYVDGRDVSLLYPGVNVRLQFEGWPVIQFSGWPSVAVGTFGGTVVAIDASANENGRFRVLVVEDRSDPNPWPDDRFVRFGTKVRGWLLLNEVSVGYELWRQLNNFPPDFNQKAQQGGAR